MSHELIAFHTEPGLQRTCVISKPAMDHTGIPAAGLIANIQVLFQYAYFQTVSGHFPGNGAAHHTAANNDYIIQLFHAAFLLKDNCKIHPMNIFYFYHIY